MKSRKVSENVESIILALIAGHLHKRRIYSANVTHEKRLYSPSSCNTGGIFAVLFMHLQQPRCNNTLSSAQDIVYPANISKLSTY